jgi:hypothetical protein
MTSKRSATTKTLLPRSPRTALVATDVPGVFRNKKTGLLVDADGIAVDFKGVKRADDHRFKEVLGRDPITPLDVMTGVAMDPRNPMHVRMDAAKHATPYLSPKLVAVQGVAGAPPINMSYENKSDTELKAIRAALENVANLMGGR